MKLFFGLFGSLLFSVICSGQFYTKVSTSFPSTNSFERFTDGVLDSNMNYYTIVDDVSNSPHSIKKLLKIDTTGTQRWSKIIYPDSLIPDTEEYWQTSLYPTPDEGLLTLSAETDLSILKCYDVNSNLLMRKIFVGESIICAYAGRGKKYYAISCDQNYVHFHHLDSAGNTLLHDLIPITGAGFQWDCIFEDKFGDIFACYVDINDSMKVLHYRNTQLIDTLRFPVGFGSLAFDDDGNRYLAGTYQIAKFDTSWNPIWSHPANLQFPIIVDSMHNIYTCDKNYNGKTPVMKFDSSGNLEWSFSFNSPGRISHYPMSLTLDSRGLPIIVGRKHDVPGSGTNQNDKIYMLRLNQSGRIDAYSEIFYPGSTAAYAGTVRMNARDELFFSSNDDSLIHYNFVATRQRPNVIGSAYYDLNSNCIRDPNEPPLPHINFTYSPSNQYILTSDSGEFYFYLPDGNYIIDCGVPVNWQQTCPLGPSPLSVSGGMVTGATDFGFRAIPGINDLAIDITHGIVRINRDVLFFIHCQNLASTTINGTIHFDFDSVFTFVSASPTPDTIGPGYVAWNFTGFNPGEDINIPVILHTGFFPGGTYTNTATILSTVGDLHPYDNLFSESGEIVASADPNEKSVVPAGIGLAGYITDDDSILCYRITFQNNGNDTAFYIMVIDTLEVNLDPLTFRLGALSMPCTYSMSNDGVLHFVFDPCALPDSITDEIHSHGFINYFIHPKHNLPDGTVIRNKAEIYFDYNAPVTTNTTVNTINRTLSVNTLGWRSNSLKIYPNPVTAQLQVDFYSDNTHLILSVFDLYGQKIIEKEITAVVGNNGMRLDISSLLPGSYVMKMKSNNLQISKKFIKME